MHLLTFASLVSVLLAAFLALRLVLRATENRAAANAFAGFLVCCALFVLDDVCYRENWWARVPWFYGAANPFIAAITPVFFLYTHAALDRGYRWRWLYLLHLLPAALLLLLQVPVYLSPVAEKLRMAADDFDPVKRRENLGFMIVLEVYFYSYVAAAWWQLWRSRRRTEESRDEGRTHPVRGVGLFATVLLVVGLTTSILDYTQWAQTGGVVAVLALVLVVFALLWLATEPQPFLTRAALAAANPTPSATELPAISAPATPVEIPAPAPLTATALPPAPETLVAAKSAEPAPEPIAKPVVAETPSAPPVDSAPSAIAEERGDDLKPAEVERIATRVRRLLESERVFLDPELSLQALATQAGTTRHKLSATLRLGFGATFHQLVSGYRVREAARVLESREGTVRTIADIAFASGFNTLSAFNAAFRAHFGITPSDHRDRAAEKRSRKS